MDIVIDFDGTVVSHEFPEIGKDIGAETVLKKLVESGHNLILFTMRSNNGNLPLITEKGIIPVNGDFLDHAVKWFEEKVNQTSWYSKKSNTTYLDYFTKGLWSNNHRRCRFRVSIKA